MACNFIYSSSWGDYLVTIDQKNGTLYTPVQIKQRKKICKKRKEKRNSLKAYCGMWNGVPERLPSQRYEDYRDYSNILYNS